MLQPRGIASRGRVSLATIGAVAGVLPGSSRLGGCGLAYVWRFANARQVSPAAARPGITLIDPVIAMTAEIVALAVLGVVLVARAPLTVLRPVRWQPQTAREPAALQTAAQIISPSAAPVSVSRSASGQ